MYAHISKYCVDTVCKTPQHITRHIEVVWILRGYLELMKWIFFLFCFCLLGGVSGSSFKMLALFCKGAASDRPVVSCTAEPWNKYSPIL